MLLVAAGPFTAQADCILRIEDDRGVAVPIILIVPSRGDPSLTLNSTANGTISVTLQELRDYGHLRFRIEFDSDLAELVYRRDLEATDGRQPRPRKLKELCPAGASGMTVTWRIMSLPTGVRERRR